MPDTLKPIGALRGAPSRSYPIFSFDGRRITPRVTPMRTLGDLLDYGYSVNVECGCKRSVTQIPAEHFLRLKRLAPESTLVRDLPDFLICKDCGSRSDIVVTPVDGSYAGVRPRKSGTMRNGYFIPYEPYVPASLSKPTG